MTPTAPSHHKPAAAAAGIGNDEVHALRMRVMMAEAAVAKARQAVVEAEVELAVAREIAARAHGPMPAVLIQPEWPELRFG